MKKILYPVMKFEGALIEVVRKVKKEKGFVVIRDLGKDYSKGDYIVPISLLVPLSKDVGMRL